MPANIPLACKAAVGDKSSDTLWDKTSHSKHSRCGTHGNTVKIDWHIAKSVVHKEEPVAKVAVLLHAEGDVSAAAFAAGALVDEKHIAAVVEVEIGDHRISLIPLPL